MGTAEGKVCKKGEDLEDLRGRPSSAAISDETTREGVVSAVPSSSSTQKNPSEPSNRTAEPFLPGEADVSHRQHRQPPHTQPSHQLQSDMSSGGAGVPSFVSDPVTTSNAVPSPSPPPPSASSQNGAGSNLPATSSGSGEVMFTSSSSPASSSTGVRTSHTPSPGGSGTGSGAEMAGGSSTKPSPAALARPQQQPHSSSSPSSCPNATTAPPLSAQGGHQHHHHPTTTGGASSPAAPASDKGSNRQLSSTTSQRRPTLFNLLDALAHDSVTTPDQRNCIRSVVTDFLNHSLPHARVYTFIGAIVGHDVLHAMVRKLEEEPAKLGAPDQGGLARIEKAFGLTKSTGGSFMNEKTEKTEKSGKPDDRNSVAGGGAAAPSPSQAGVHTGGAVTTNYTSGRGGGGGGGSGGAASSADQQAPGHHSTTADTAVSDPAVSRTMRVQGTSASQNNCSPAVTPNVKLGALGAHHAREEVVIRAMRRNLEARRQLQGSLDVFDRVKWLPVRRTLTPVPVFGHSLITFSNTAVLFGGSNTEGAVSFRNLFVVNTNDFSVRGFPMSGESPCERDGHTTTGLTTAGGPAVILFGGCSKETFLNDVYVLEVDQKKYVTHRTSHTYDKALSDLHVQRG
ncbi:corepressor complex crc230, partial [Cystoisospora suis]